MLTVRDDITGVELSPRYVLGQRVVTLAHQGYRKGTVTAVTVTQNDEDVQIWYTIEGSVGRNVKPQTRRCTEDRVYETVDDALAALRERDRYMED